MLVFHFVQLPVAVWPLFLCKELVDHPFGNARKAVRHMLIRYIQNVIFFFYIIAVLVDSGVSRLDDVLNSVHSVAVHKYSHCFIAV